MKITGIGAHVQSRNSDRRDKLGHNPKRFTQRVGFSCIWLAKRTPPTISMFFCEARTELFLLKNQGNLKNFMFFLFSTTCHFPKIKVFNFRIMSKKSSVFEYSSSRFRDFLGYASVVKKVKSRKIHK